LTKCNENKDIDGYCIVTVKEVTNSLRGNRPLFYLGSDSLHHYFIYAYDRTIKLSANMKINKNEFALKYKEFGVQRNEISYDFPVYLDDMDKKDR
jgi:hypothetical protein